MKIHLPIELQNKILKYNRDLSQLYWEDLYSFRDSMHKYYKHIICCQFKKFEVRYDLFIENTNHVDFSFIKFFFRYVYLDPFAGIHLTDDEYDRLYGYNEYPIQLFINLVDIQPKYTIDKIIQMCTLKVKGKNSFACIGRPYLEQYQ